MRGVHRLTLAVATAAATDVWNANPQDFTAQKHSADAMTDFDFYVFAHSWQPSFCAGEDYPGCSVPDSYWASHFTIHGLWPELANGPHPGFCTKEPLDINSVRTAIGEGVLEQYWPNVKVAANTTHYDSFWAHEWSRHGTCRGLDQVAFFQSAIDKIKSQGTPDFITQHVGQTVSTKDVRDAFGGVNHAVLQCENGNELSQVFTCYDKDVNSNVPTTLRACAPHVLAEDTCTSKSTVFIRSFG
ncbi:hypothetical protein H310_06179 [Aphanomyces invadans]|uniref:Uncharacterized protein n=1 Tax=Aphanomyces invadans TaxID=157072 RepID=A0A024U5M4_9STRA|nr:hypothetical protein H310_06179 [Aphanomyces invadans]ETW01515.1 hypothetical protein H310_06179 [Aphanomyces invadans]|eukprot:XP_008869363.1 hypothetical protein H310_06179 [Aphanomyces invadans]